MMKYRTLSKKENDTALIRIVDELLKPLPTAGKKRKEDWEKGWGQNLKEGDIIPRYFGKYKINRLNGKLVYALSKNYEREALYSILDPLFKKYSKGCRYIHEFGCGTGHNLKRAAEMTNCWPIGSDWAESSQKIVRKMGFSATNFDFFNPNMGVEFYPDTCVYTVAALEQVGTKYKKFVQYLLNEKYYDGPKNRNKPIVIFHVEPIEELLDPTNLLDYLSLKYMKKRKYLSGYLTYLRKLEKQGKIQILEARRSGIGSMFIDGYSIIAWKPL